MARCWPPCQKGPGEVDSDPPAACRFTFPMRQIHGQRMAGVPLRAGGAARARPEPDLDAVAFGGDTMTDFWGDATLKDGGCRRRRDQHPKGWFAFRA